MGGFHETTKLGLTVFFAVESSRAAGFAIVHHGICFIPITILGLLCLPAFGVSLREVSKVAGEGAAAAESLRDPPR
jgi:hypothetical protein